MDMSQILDAIRKAILAGDKTRYRLWKETGIDQGQLSKLMSGEKGLSLDNLERLCEALDLTITIGPKRRRAKKVKD